MGEIKRYKVKLWFVYSDTVEVDAYSKEEAKDNALDLAEPTYEYWQDAEVEEL